MLKRRFCYDFVVEFSFRKIPCCILFGSTGTDCFSFPFRGSDGFKHFSVSSYTFWSTGSIFIFWGMNEVDISSQAVDAY